MNEDAGFGVEVLWRICDDKEIEAYIALNARYGDASSEQYQYFDDEFCSERFVIGRTNAGLDGFKRLLIRFEKKIQG